MNMACDELGYGGGCWLRLRPGFIRFPSNVSRVS